MNSTISKAFYTCSTELLFSRYKKISKEAVKIGGFLQYSVHIFLMAVSEKLIELKIL